jgi:hypothetical protein
LQGFLSASSTAPLGGLYMAFSYGKGTKKSTKSRAFAERNVIKSRKIT